MFGRGKFHAGVLVIPDKPFDPFDFTRLAEYRNAIWLVTYRYLNRHAVLTLPLRPTVEQANSFAPSHSRIFKEVHHFISIQLYLTLSVKMIIVANPAKPFELTAKGTPRRHVVLEAYADEIEAVYEAVEQSSQAHLQPPSEFTQETTLPFIRQVLTEIMPRVPGDDDDIFQHGCDRCVLCFRGDIALMPLVPSAYKRLGYEIRFFMCFVLLH